MSPATNPRRELRAYVVYDAAVGEEDSAVLVFHFTARQARDLGWPACEKLAGGYFLHARTRWLQEGATFHADPEKLARKEPHVVEDPTACEICERWYPAGVDDEGWCQSCVEWCVEAEGPDAA